jgi:hypothetical protein
VAQHYEFGRALIRIIKIDDCNAQVWPARFQRGQRNDARHWPAQYAAMSRWLFLPAGRFPSSAFDVYYLVWSLTFVIEVVLVKCSFPWEARNAHIPHHLRRPARNRDAIDFRATAGATSGTHRRDNH